MYMPNFPASEQLCSTLQCRTLYNTHVWKVLIIWKYSCDTAEIHSVPDTLIQYISEVGEETSTVIEECAGR